MVINMCGIVLTRTLNDAYRAVEVLGSRGQDATGITCLYDGKLYTVRWQGMANTFNLDNLSKFFENHFGITKDTDAIYIGHTRYKTAGETDFEKVISASHPIVIGDSEEYHQRTGGITSHIITIGGEKAIVHNGNIPDYGVLADFVKQNGYDLRTEIDTEALLSYIDMRGVERGIKDIPGAYACLIADASKNCAYAIRDRYGIRPLIHGQKDGKAIFASETHTINELGGEVIDEVKPGEYITTDMLGRTESRRVESECRKAPCIFEFIYLSKTESVINHKLVRTQQEDAGVRLWEEHRNIISPRKNKIIVHLPDRPYYTAQVLSEISVIEHVPCLYKTRRIRSFLQLTQDERTGTIMKNLFFNPELRSKIAGKDVIVVDDSLVRGTNSPYTIQLLRENGANSVSLLLASSMIGGNVNEVDAFCDLGVAMSDSKEFATTKYGRDPEKIAEGIGADYVGYLSIENMLRSAGLSPNSTCLKCFTGENFLPPLELR